MKSVCYLILSVVVVASGIGGPVADRHPQRAVIARLRLTLARLARTNVIEFTDTRAGIIYRVLQAIMPARTEEIVYERR